IGAITFSGSVIAFAKLNGNMSGAPILLPARHVINLGTLAAIIALTAVYALSGNAGPGEGATFWIIVALAFAIGFLLIIPTGGAAKVDRPWKRGSAEDAAFMLKQAENVIIIPGYGMAVAQAQHALREMADLLKEEGVNVKYAIHPVAGRMPGHMNVLLAEAQV